MISSCVAMVLKHTYNVILYMYSYPVIDLSCTAALYVSCSREVFVELLRQYNWRHVVLLAEDGQDFPEYHGYLENKFLANNIKVELSIRLPRQATSDDAYKVRK